MKISISSPLLACTFGTLISLAVVGCNSNPVASPQVQEQLREQAAIRSLQNPAGCLDLSKLGQKMDQAKKSRTTLLDVKLDGKPSDKMLAHLSDSIAEDEADDAQASNKQDDSQQTGCSSISIKNNDGTSSVDKIIASSENMLKIQGDAGTPGSESAFTMTIELLSDHQIQMTVEYPVVIPHDCNGKTSNETLTETEVDVTDFGDTLPAQPSQSAETQDLKKSADAQKASRSWQRLHSTRKRVLFVAEVSRHSHSIVAGGLDEIS